MSTGSRRDPAAARRRAALSTSLRGGGGGGLGEIRERSAEEAFDVPGLDDPPVDEHLRRGGRQDVPGRQFPNEGRIGSEKGPLPRGRPPQARRPAPPGPLG